ncbi:hypothetical protein V3C99_004016 [Haemonchus contortus]
MAEQDDEYRSSDDEDYVPEEGVEDVECSSGDEVDEVTENGTVLTSKRKRGGKDKLVTKEEKSCTPAEPDNDAEAAFMALMAEKDPILGKARAEVSAGPSVSTKPCASLETIASTSSSSVQSTPSESQSKDTAVITQVFDFAGDEVKVQRVVSAEEAKEIEAKEKRKENEKSKKPTQKRLGIGAALTLLAKKPKMSVLDKSDLDWNLFKTEKNLKEELETFNRGKNGYLDKMEFLTRTDYKEFEKEKALRNATRKPI